MRSVDRALLGFFAASLVPSVTFALLEPLSGELDVLSFAGTFVVVYMWSLLAVIVLGGPAFLMLRRFAPGRWWWVMMVGFVLGMCVEIIIMLPNLPSLRGFPQMGALGAASALVFWLIWRRGQERADAASTDAASPRH